MNDTVRVVGAIAFGIIASACAGRPGGASADAAFDPLQYPGDSALTCDALVLTDGRTVTLQFTGTDSSPAMQRRLTARFEPSGAPKFLELVAPEPGQTPPRAHVIQVAFQPEIRGTRTVMVAYPDSGLAALTAAANAAARPIDDGDAAKARSFMDRLWARRCSRHVG